MRTPLGLTENHIEQFKEEVTQMVKMPRAKNFLHGPEGLRIPHSNQENSAKFRYNNGAVDIKDEGSGTRQSNNFTGNPNFIDASTGNFDLQDQSSAIDAGVNLGAAVPTDLRGVVRPQGKGFDIGAYEFGGSVQNTDPPSPPTNLKIAEN